MIYSYIKIAVGCCLLFAGGTLFDIYIKGIIAIYIIINYSPLLTQHIIIIIILYSTSSYIYYSIM